MYNIYSIRRFKEIFKYEVDIVISCWLEGMIAMVLQFQLIY